MKNYLYILIVSIVFSCSSDEIITESDITTENTTTGNLEENIFAGDVVLSSQEAIDNFGELNITAIVGNLIIGDASTNGGDLRNIENLLPLLDLTQVYGKLIIGNTTLSSLNGLQNILSCDSLLILRNDNLETLEGLSPQISFSNQLLIDRNYNLTSLLNFEGINSHVNEIDITGNSSLENLNGLNNLTSIRRLRIINNPILVNIDALQNVTILTHSLVIISNTSLSSLLGLQNLTTILTDLTVTDGTNGGFMEISFNSSLNSLEGLNNLIETSAYLINSNANLDDFCALQNLFINGEVFFPNASFIGGNAFNPTVEDIQAGNCSI